MEKYDLITSIVGVKGKRKAHPSLLSIIDRKYFPRKKKNKKKLSRPSSTDVKTEDLTEYGDDEKTSPVSTIEEFSPMTIPSSTDQLMSILAENGNGDGETRKAICIKPKPPRRREPASTTVANMLQVHLQRGGICTDGTGIIASKYAGIGSSAGKQKIPRPANAFMLFANEWRKKLAIQNPRESNKDISVRLVFYHSYL